MCSSSTYSIWKNYRTLRKWKWRIETKDVRIRPKNRGPRTTGTVCPYSIRLKDDDKCLAIMLLLCSVCLGCQDFFTSRHLRSRFYRIPKRYYSEIFGLPGLSHRLKRTSLSGAAKHYEEVFILTLRKIDSFLKDKAEVNWDFLKRFRGRLMFCILKFH